MPTSVCAAVVVGKVPEIAIYASIAACRATSGARLGRPAAASRRYVVGRLASHCKRQPFRLITFDISHLAAAAKQNRDALVCKLNSYAQPTVEARSTRRYSGSPFGAAGSGQ